MLASSNKYVFRVNPRSNKNEVKKAIEKVYDVKVLKVNIINTFGKNRRYGQTMGRTKDWKKAVITVAKGQRIEGVTATEQA
ncbi:MAG: 50S ribosomal protein L23 [Candidatus Doudnabacteria bacterium RIFCSPHIGHO2_01_FULL_43_23]|uniref:Large ribosomal subunit protein uL23 n=1 Tax=Candidatus Doudnabacteria bacterium RIFCSPHIGHO2_01_FULL_43_23 TaxID=1817822 RepID=A0A1F5NVI1_9BACT|nr:MAG: 50S ribosomal protein L23 [Candidatus Doudnabacteria bacterium RIFCSPHIGHO2_01_FULL_43_23]